MHKREVYFKNDKILTFNEIVEKYGSNEFKSPYRSTIPLLVLFKNQKWNNFGLIENSDETNAKYIFEFETPVKKGNGGPSCTDLIIEYQNACIAIESKRTEPPYETVKNWLGDSNNRKLVLEGWLEMIGDYIKNKIDARLINDLPYQLVHRVASACSMGKLKTKVVYLGFDLDKTKMDYYSSNLDFFSKLLKSKIDIDLICFQLDKSGEQKRLELLWDSGERDLSEFIVNGIKHDTLMKIA
ncbi:MAG TPA: hypothetical protein VGQ59_04330 [Cyclobacteriaceae bacterium]|jgi:hypothetical protein|nr:hypothetical protein [Cyclobacteriaceae bacterium]